MVDFIEIKKFSIDRVNNSVLIFDDDVVSTSKLIKTMLKNKKRYMIITNTTAYFSYAKNVYSYNPKLLSDVWDKQVKLYDKKITDPHQRARSPKRMLCYAEEPITVVISIKQINDDFELLTPSFFKNTTYGSMLYYGRHYNIKLITHIYSLTHVNLMESRAFDTVFMRSYEKNNIVFNKDHKLDYERIKEKYKNQTYNIIYKRYGDNVKNKEQLIALYDKCNEYDKYLVYNYTSNYEENEKKTNELSPPLYYY